MAQLMIEYNWIIRILWILFMKVVEIESISFRWYKLDIKLKQLCEKNHLVYLLSKLWYEKYTCNRHNIDKIWVSYTNVLNDVLHESFEYLLNRKMKKCTEQMNQIIKWI